MKTHFTRKNYIAMALMFFFVAFSFIAALLVDGNNPLGIKPSMNLILHIGSAFGFPNIIGSAGCWILTSIVLIYILIFTAAFIFEMRLAKYYGEKANSKKWILVYSITFILSFALAIGIGMVSQYPYEPEYMKNSVLFLLESLVLGLILFVVFGLLIGSITMLVVNLKNIDKPFRMFGEKVKKEQEEEAKEIKEEEASDQEQGRLAESFGESSTIAEGGYAGVTNLTSNAISNGGATSNVSGPVLGDKERVFPGLCTVDVIEQARKETRFNDDVDLSTLCSQFRNYLAKNEKLYFDIETIRAFISGLAASRLIILEGLSGTGKSSLARYFSEFIGEESYFEAVQATWRDKTSILGYYNDFSKTYNETEFLKRLYQATYRSKHINIMVLDEINISRVEYYFADFLSIMEYPVDKWKLKIMQLPYDFAAPKHLPDGILNIPVNTWFIGTANKDDSTYTITDKVYDRAITIAFDDRNEEFKVTENVEKIKISYQYLQSLFNESIETAGNSLTNKEKAQFSALTDFTNDTFDLTFGNRINHQIELFVPVYVACGGSKKDALDFMFSRKIVSKLTGRFEDYIKQGLLDLQALITKTYGEGSFPRTNKEIARLLRKL